MPSLLPRFSFSVCRWMVSAAVTPTLIVGLVCWAVMLSSALHTARQRHQRITTGIANVLQQRLLAIDGMMAQTALAADAVSRSERSSLLAASLGASQSVQAIIVLSPDDTVRDIAMRQDLASLRENIAGLDFSRLFQLLHATEGSRFLHGSRSPIDGRPLFAAAHRLKSGETLLAVLDIEAISSGLHDTSDGSAMVIWAPDCLLVLGQDAGSDALIAQVQSSGKSPTTGPAQMTRDRQLLAGASVDSAALRVAVSSIAPADLATSGAPLVALISTAVACVLAAIGAAIIGYRLSRPIGALSSQIKQAIARQEQATLPRQPYLETESIAGAARQLVIGCRDTQGRLATIQQAIQTASAPLPRTADASPLSELASVLASVTGARCVLIAEWLKGTKPRAHVLAAHTNVPLPSDLSYELNGSPAQRVANSPLVHIRTRVLREYPENTLLRMLGAESYVCVPLMVGGEVGGHLEIIDDQDLLLTDSLRDLLALFAARAAGEIERIQAQRDRRETIASYSSIRADQTEWICRWAADTTLTLVNDPMCQAMGIAREQLLGRSLLSVLHEDDRQAFQERYRELSPDAPACGTDLRVVCPEGERWLRWTSRALIDDKGRITEYQGTARDITPLRQLVSELEDIRLRYAVLADNCPAAFWITDWTTQRCTYMNPVFRRLWGLAPEVAGSTSMAWTSAVHDEDRPHVVRRYLLHAAEGLYQATYRIVRPDGSIARVRDRAIPLRNAEGQVHLIANIAMEITGDLAVPDNEPQEIDAIVPPAP